MAYQRTDALAYVQGLYPRISTFMVEEAEWVNDDVAAGYKPALDNAGMKYGLDWDSLPTLEIPTGDILKFQALLKYYTLTSFEGHLLADEVVNVEGASQKVESKASNILAAVQKALLRAEAELTTYDIAMTARNVATVGVFRTNRLEPASRNSY